jgi:hypothetical protein
MSVLGLGKIHSVQSLEHLYLTQPGLYSVRFSREGTLSMFRRGQQLGLDGLRLLLESPNISFVDDLRPTFDLEELAQRSKAVLVQRHKC